jgi:hypothetical protein
VAGAVGERPRLACERRGRVRQPSQALGELPEERVTVAVGDGAVLVCERAVLEVEIQRRDL